MRAKPSDPRGHVKRVIQSANCVGLLLTALKRADLTHYKLFTHLIFFQLVLDLLRNSACVLSWRVHIVPFVPEFSAPILVFQFAELLIQHSAAFSFQISHEARHRHLWRNLQQHVYLIRAHFCLYDIYTFPFTQLPQYLSYCHSFLFIEHFSPVFRRKHNMVFAFQLVCDKLLMSFRLIWMSSFCYFLCSWPTALPV